MKYNEKQINNHSFNYIKSLVDYFINREKYYNDLYEERKAKIDSIDKINLTFLLAIDSLERKNANLAGRKVIINNQYKSLYEAVDSSNSNDLFNRFKKFFSTNFN